MVNVTNTEDLLQEATSKIGQLETIGRLLWALVVLVAGVAAWATKLNIEVANNGHNIQQIQLELERRRDWMDKTSENMARIDERLVILQKLLEQHNELLRRNLNNQ